jgi:multidrug resistance efflux pump
MPRFRPLAHGLPLLAAAALTFAIVSVVNSHQPRRAVAPAFAPPTSPYPARVAGIGMVEPASETIAVATEQGGVVARVFVVAGQRVAAGAPLFALDDRAWRAALADADAAFAQAEAAIETLARQHDFQDAAIAEARARLASAAAERARAEADHARIAALAARDWASRQKLDAAVADRARAAAAENAAKAAVEAALRQQAVIAAQAREAAARRDAASAKRERARIDLDRATIRAPIAGAVLRVNVRVGEYAAPGVLAEPLVALGAVDLLHVRVDIDETDAWRVRDGAPATAQLRGNAAIRATLVFVRLEPMVTAKRNLAGGAQERVDTRVMQAIYAFDPKAFPARVGQQVDVFIAAAPGAGAPAAGAPAEPPANGAEAKR